MTDGGSRSSTSNIVPSITATRIAATDHHVSERNSHAETAQPVTATQETRYIACASPKSNGAPPRLLTTIVGPRVLPLSRIGSARVITHAKTVSIGRTRASLVTE